jgi:hypothetical protein
MSQSRQTEILEQALAPLVLLSTESTKKIQLTIAGATAGAGKVANISVLWRPLVAGGYYLNA